MHMGWACIVHDCLHSLKHPLIANQRTVDRECVVTMVHQHVDCGGRVVWSVVHCILCARVAARGYL